MTGHSLHRKPFTPDPRYTESFKLMIVREFEQGSLNMKQISRKYAIPGDNTVLRWCRKYGKLHYSEPRRGIIGRPMKDPAQQKIKELEQALKDERLKVHAYEKLLEIIKREDGIDLLKKDAARQFPNLPRSTGEK